MIKNSLTGNTRFFFLCRKYLNEVIMKKYIIFITILLVILTTCSNKKSGETKTDSNIELESVTENKSFTILGRWQYVVTDSSWIEWTNSPPSLEVNSDMSACFNGPFSDLIGEIEQTDTYRFIFTPKLAFGEGELWDISDREKDAYVYDPATDRLIYEDRARIFIKVEELGSEPYTFLPVLSRSVWEGNNEITVNFIPQVGGLGKLISLELNYDGKDHKLVPPNHLEPIIFEYEDIHHTSVDDFNEDGNMDVRFKRVWGTGKDDVYDTYIYNPEKKTYVYDEAYSKPWVETSHEVHVTKSFKGEPFNIWVTYITVGKNKNLLTEISVRFGNAGITYMINNQQIIFTMNNSPDDPFDVDLITVHDFNSENNSPDDPSDADLITVLDFISAKRLIIEFKGDNSTWRSF